MYGFHVVYAMAGGKREVPSFVRRPLPQPAKLRIVFATRSDCGRRFTKTGFVHMKMRRYIMQGCCYTGDACTFAHAMEELHREADQADFEAAAALGSSAAADQNASPKIKLTYFNSEGAAEKVRMAFVLGGVEFEDERIDSKSDREALKPKTKFGQLPMMTIGGDGGESWAQSGGMLRYPSMLVGLYLTEDPHFAGRGRSYRHPG